MKHGNSHGWGILRDLGHFWDPQMSSPKLRPMSLMIATDNTLPGRGAAWGMEEGVEGNMQGRHRRKHAGRQTTNQMEGALAEQEYLAGEWTHTASA